jgi:hypothetical protein
LLGVVVGVVLGAAFFSCLSTTIAGIVLKRDRLMGIGQAITMPLFFASSGLYPIALMPGWLQAISRVNPLSYEVAALRGCSSARRPTTGSTSPSWAGPRLPWSSPRPRSWAGCPDRAGSRVGARSTAGRSFLPSLISQPFHDGLVVASIPFCPCSPGALPDALAPGGPAVESAMPTLRAVTSVNFIATSVVSLTLQS